MFHELQTGEVIARVDYLAALYSYSRELFQRLYILIDYFSFLTFSFSLQSDHFHYRSIYMFNTTNDVSTNYMLCGIKD